METIGQGCWLCNIFALSYDISVVLSERVFERLGAPLANLIAFALGVWVLFQAAKLMAPFGPMAGPTGIANMIFIRLGIALIIMTMLRFGFSSYNDLIQAPIMGAGVELSQELLNTASNTLSSLGSMWKKPDCEDSFIPTPYITAAATYYNNHPEANTTRRNFICLPRQMQDTLGSGMAFGISNIMAAGNLGQLSGEAIVRSFDRFFSGVVLVALYFIAIIIFGMFLLDMLFRFILTGALSPIWLASAVFPNTRFAFSQGVRQLARCALTLVFMTVLIVIAAGLIGISTQNALTNGQATLKPDQKTAVNACLAKGAAAAAYCKSKGTADKDCDMSYGSGNAPTATGATPGSLATPTTSGSSSTSSSSTAPTSPTTPTPATPPPTPVPATPGSLARPISFTVSDTPSWPFAPASFIQPANYNPTSFLQPANFIAPVYNASEAPPLAIPIADTTTTTNSVVTPSLPAGQCPSVNIGAGGGVGAGMGGSVSQPPVNTQPWGGSPDPEAIMFSCMMNVGGFTIGLGNPAFYQMLAGVLVVLLYMSRMYNLAAMYVGVRQSAGPTLGQLMAGITMKGIGIAGGAAAGFAGALASMTIAGGGKLLGNTIGKATKRPRDELANIASQAGTAIADTAQKAQDSLSRQASRITEPFVSEVSGHVQNISQSVGTHVESYRNYLGGIATAAVATATPTIKALEQSADNLKNWAGDVTKPVRDVADRAGQTIGGIAQAADKATSGIRQNIQETAASVGEEVGNKLNEFDNFVQSAQSFLNNLGKAPQNAAMAVLAPVILATSQGLDRLSPAQREALANATGAAAQIGRVVKTVASSPIVGGAAKLVKGAARGAEIGFKLDELIADDSRISFGLQRTKAEKEAEEGKRFFLKDPNDRSSS